VFNNNEVPRGQEVNMAGYDASVDVVVAVIGSTEGCDESKGGIRVTLNRYNGGALKVGMVRMRTKKDGVEKFGKLGRMLPDEATAVLPYLAQAVAAAATEVAEAEAEEAPEPAPEPVVDEEPAPEPVVDEEPAPAPAVDEEDEEDGEEPTPEESVRHMSKADLREICEDLGIDDPPKGIARLRKVVADAWRAAA